MQIKQTIRHYRRSIVASGSPFRVLRKAAMYAKNPVETATRLIDPTGLRRNLSPEVSASLENMNRDGFSYAHGELDPTLMAELTNTIDTRMQEPGIVEKNISERKFWSQIQRPEDLRPDSVFVRFALQPNLVKLAAAYLKMVPYLSSVQALVSFGTECGQQGQWTESQLWHRDYHDTKTLRMWLYLSDVSTPEHGPFTYLPAGYSRQVKNTFFPRRISDEAMDQSGIAKHAQPVYGNRNTPFYIDTTRCYHLGSRVALGERRIAYLATFNTHASVYPFYNGIKVEGQLSPLQKLLLCA